jgi:hypothetical protein
MVSRAFSVLSEVPLKDPVQPVNRAINMRKIRLFIDTSEI